MSDNHNFRWNWYGVMDQEEEESERRKTVIPQIHRRKRDTSSVSRALNRNVIRRPQ